MFRKLLVANRGEIALRVMRTAKEMGIASVAVYSEPDRDSLHVAFADEAYCIGAAAPSESYLNVEKILDIAKRSGAEAIHPGYGFLAENAAFARKVLEAHLIWVGPHPDSIDAMGDKVRARQAMVKAGVPVVPGGTQEIADVQAARAAAGTYGLPLALKASGGGGGKGLKVARTLEEIDAAFTTAQREATAYFKNGAIYAERYLDNPKHIELQILADKFGNVVHVGERDCSLQRRHQKLWEEAPARISKKVRKGLREAGIKAAKAIRYDSVGTIECLVAGDEFYFLEMNTRIQVEHTVSEMISGLDLIREQIRVAAGEQLGYDQDAIEFRGYAIEGRVNAEDPGDQFRPAPGTIAKYREPSGLGIRIDSAAYQGYTISADYDSMIAKLIVWAPTRDQARERLRRAIDEYVIEGVPTTLPLLRGLIDLESVKDGTYGTSTLEQYAAGAFASPTNGAPHDTPPASAGTAPAETIRVEVNDKLFRVRLLDLPVASASTNARPAAPRRNVARKSSVADGNDVRSPMHGVVVELSVKEGDAVATGQVVAIVEAMKMMNEIRAHKDGIIAKVHAAAGETIEAQSPLVTLQ